MAGEAGSATESAPEATPQPSAPVESTTLESVSNDTETTVVFITTDAQTHSLTLNPKDDKPRNEKGKDLSLSTLAIHADDHISVHRAVAPPLHVSTTFKYSRDPDALTVWENIDVSSPQTN
jgi:hypothetical protein